MNKGIKLTITGVLTLCLASCSGVSIISSTPDLNGCWTELNSERGKLQLIRESDKLYLLNEFGRNDRNIAHLEIVDGNKVIYKTSLSLPLQGKIINSEKIEIMANSDESILLVMKKVSCSEPVAPVPTSTTTSPEQVIKPEMILVQGGTFQMGDTFNEGGDDAKPVHSVTVSSFYIGKYEVTQKEYQSLMGSNPWKYNGDNLPVGEASWFDAIKYCNAKSQGEGLALAYNPSTGDLLDESGNVTTDVTKVKGYRLPTEAEWEYAAKGGNKSSGYKYSGSNSPDIVAVYNASKTSTVGSKTPNELGLFDMSGNVWEWVQDWYDEGYYGKSPSNNPWNSVFLLDSRDSPRVFRGGSYGYYSAGALRVFIRGGSPPGSREPELGFRLSRTNG